MKALSRMANGSQAEEKKPDEETISTMHKKVKLATELRVVMLEKWALEAKEKALKGEIKELFDKKEKVEGVSLSVQRRFSPGKELEEKLKELGVWERATEEKRKVNKDKVKVLATEEFPSLQEFLDGSYKEIKSVHVPKPKG